MKSMYNLCKYNVIRKRIYNYRRCFSDHTIRSNLHIDYENYNHKYNILRKTYNSGNNKMEN